jgi:hypothetical protein
VVGTGSAAASSQAGGRTRREGYVALNTGLLIIAFILYAEIFAYK